MISTCLSCKSTKFCKTPSAEPTYACVRPKRIAVSAASPQCTGHTAFTSRTCTARSTARISAPAAEHICARLPRLGRRCLLFAAFFPTGALLPRLRLPVLRTAAAVRPCALFLRHGGPGFAAGRPALCLLPARIQRKGKAQHLQPCAERIIAKLQHKARGRKQRQKQQAQQHSKRPAQHAERREQNSRHSPAPCRPAAARVIPVRRPPAARRPAPPAPAYSRRRAAAEAGPGSPARTSAERRPSCGTKWACRANRACRPLQ